MAIPDRFLVRGRSREMTILAGRWTGNGTGQPTRVTGTGRDVTVVRTGVGAFDITMASAWPFIQQADINLHSATRRNVKVTPFNTSTKKWTVQISDSADAAIDITTAEELQIEIFVSATGSNP